MNRIITNDFIFLSLTYSFELILIIFPIIL